MKKAEIIARIERLEELIVAMHDRGESKALARQVDAELYTESRTATPCPRPLGSRIQDVELRFNMEDETDGR